MNDWLKQRALSNQQRNLSRVFVLACPEDVVRAYFTLSSHNLSRDFLTAKDKRGVTEELVPAQLLGRFATDTSVKKQDLGELLMDLVFEKYLEILERTTCGYLCLDAKNEWLVNYYQKTFGFSASAAAIAAPGTTFMYMKTSAILDRFGISAVGYEAEATA